MKEPTPSSDAEARIAHEASAWVLRCDRGLTPREQDEFSEWLAADPRHGAQLGRQRSHWRRLDSLASWRPEHGATPNPDLLAPPTRARMVAFLPYAAALAAAAAVIFLFVRPAETPPPPVASAAKVAASASTTQTLPDGTLVELNHGAVVTEEFSATERRVRLQHGEAHFAVTKNPARPFIVHAGGVDIRAVGTAFNVRLAPGNVEVLVTEGRVGVTRETARARAAAVAAEAAPPPAPLQLAARQRAVVSLRPDAPAPQVATLTAGEIERVLAWQHRLLDFTATPLRGIVAEFNRRNVVQISIADPELAATRLSAAFRTDNLDGFIHLLEAGFGAVAEHPTPESIVLRRVRK